MSCAHPCPDDTLCLWFLPNCCLAIQLLFWMLWSRLYEVTLEWIYYVLLSAQLDTPSAISSIQSSQLSYSFYLVLCSELFWRNLMLRRQIITVLLVDSTWEWCLTKSTCRLKSRRHNKMSLSSFYTVFQRNWLSQQKPIAYFGTTKSVFIFFMNCRLLANENSDSCSK